MHLLSFSFKIFLLVLCFLFCKNSPFITYVFLSDEYVRTYELTFFYCLQEGFFLPIDCLSFVYFCLDVWKIFSGCVFFSSLLLPSLLQYFAESRTSMCCDKSSERAYDCVYVCVQLFARLSFHKILLSFASLGFFFISFLLPVHCLHVCHLPLVLFASITIFSACKTSFRKTLF